MFFVVVVDAVFGLPTTPFETQAANVQGVMTIYHWNAPGRKTVKSVRNT